MERFNCTIKSNNILEKHWGSFSNMFFSLFIIKLEKNKENSFGKIGRINTQGYILSALSLILSQ